MLKKHIKEYHNQESFEGMSVKLESDREIIGDQDISHPDNCTVSTSPQLTEQESSYILLQDDAKCFECNTYFLNEYRLKKHQIEYHSEKTFTGHNILKDIHCKSPHPCYYCNVIESSRPSLTKHIHNIHPGLPTKYGNTNGMWTPLTKKNQLKKTFI